MTGAAAVVEDAAAQRHETAREPDDAAAYRSGEVKAGPTLFMRELVPKPCNAVVVPLHLMRTPGTGSQCAHAVSVLGKSLLRVDRTKSIASVLQRKR